MAAKVAGSRIILRGGASFGDLRAHGVRVKEVRQRGGRQKQRATEKRINDVESQVEATQTKVKQHDAKLAELDNATRQALERAQQAGKLAEGKFVYSLVLSDDAVKFPVNQHELSTGSAWTRSTPSPSG